ncbi:MAG TPA: transposase [Verrucomicrobiae bacterium]
MNPADRGIALAAPCTFNRSAAEGVVPALEKIVAAIRQRCRKARIIVRGDSGFGREEIMAWCEGQQAVVYYCLGLAKNGILIERLALALADARARRCLSGAAQVRVIREFEYRTQTSWSCWQRVIGKAEVMAAGDNPRFVVTNLPAEGFKGQEDRLSTHYLASNQLRLWLATLGYLLLERLRRLGLAGTDLARATVGRVRLKLLKAAAQVRVSVRRVYVQLSSAYPLQALFRLGHRRLMRLAPASG